MTSSIVDENNNDIIDFINITENKIQNLFIKNWSFNLSNDLLKILIEVLTRLKNIDCQIKHIQNNWKWKNDFAVNNISNNYNDVIYSLNTKINKLENEIEELKNNGSKSIDCNTCCVCLNETSTHANKECGHLCVCESCSYHLDDKCPICRANGNFIKIIKS